MSDIASPAVDIALVAAIEGDDVLAAMLAGHRVYSGEVPANSPLDYVQLVDGNETDDWPAFRTPGSEGETELHLWTLDTSRMTALRLFAELHRVLRRVPLTGHVMLAGRLRLVTMFLDPDRTAMHAVCRYAWRTRVVV